MYLAPLSKEFPLELGTGAGVSGATRPRKKFDDIFSRVDKIHQLNRRTDRRTDGQWTTEKTALMHSVAR